MPSVAVVIVGNEILSGKFADENGPWLIRRLRSLGADLRRLVVVPDVVDVIADEVRRSAAAHDLVITTGGVGPTHDDVTLEGIAGAFASPLEEREELVGLMRQYEMPIDEVTIRMARVPVGAELVWAGPGVYPVLRVANVWVFPGVPKLLHAKFESIAERFAGEAVRVARVVTSLREADFAEALSTLARAYPSVELGSYPRFGEREYHAILTLESRDPDALAAAEAELRARLAAIEGHGGSGRGSEP